MKNKRDGIFRDGLMKPRMQIGRASISIGWIYSPYKDLSNIDLIRHSKTPRSCISSTIKPHFHTYCEILRLELILYTPRLEGRFWLDLSFSIEFFSLHLSWFLIRPPLQYNHSERPYF